MNSRSSRLIYWGLGVCVLASLACLTSGIRWFNQKQQPETAAEVNDMPTAMKTPMVNATVDPSFYFTQAAQTIEARLQTSQVPALPDNSNDQPAATEAPPSATFEPTETKRPSATPLPPIPTTDNRPDFSDSFNKGIKPEWVYQKGVWGTKNGQLTKIDGGDRIYLGDKSWTNYSVQFDVNKSNLSVSFFIQSSESEKTFVMIGKDYSNEGKFLLHFPNGDQTTKNYALPISVKVVFQDAIITTLVDGKSIYQFSVDGYDSGGIAFDCLSDCLIDNVVVTPLD